MTTKIAVSLPDHLVAEAKDAVARGEAASVSAFVAAALEAHLTRAAAPPAPPVRPLEEVLAEVLAETGGAATEQERAAVRERLGWE